MRRETMQVLFVVLALVLVGVLEVYSAVSFSERLVNPLSRHLLYVTVGLIGMAVAARLDYHRLGDPLLFRLIVVTSLLLLILVLLPGIGDARKGAQRWLEIGGVSFQPSEFGKFALILLLAVKLSRNQEHIRSLFRGFAPALFITGVFVTLVLLEQDLGAPVVMLAVAFLMLLMAGAPWLYLIVSSIPALFVIGFLAYTVPYRMARLMAFLDPWSQREETGWHLIQSLAAFASGGIWGQGPGGSQQKLHYLPEAHTDFIFAIWGEEMGLVGSLALVGLYVVFLRAGLRIAMNAKDLFGALLAGGIVALVALQAVINMAVTTGLLPTKGLTLPFVSYGGTSLMTFLVCAGVLMSVGLQAQQAGRQSRLAPAH
jgi:cell division protein FtsW